MSERIVADPTEVSTARTALDITDWVGPSGIDWGDAEIAVYMAEMGYGSVPVDFRVPNRTITIPLMLKSMGGTSFATARENIQAKVALWQQEGGWLKRVASNGGTLYCDIVNATLRLPGSWSQAHKNYDAEASLTLEALPDFYGDEQTLADHTETSAAELIFTETGVDGNYPARVRIVVDEDQGQSQLGLMWGFRSRNYSSASTAALAYEAEALGTLDTAAKAALSGASGGTVVTHGTLSTSWTPVLNLAVGGTTYLTHIGSYRMWCRYRTTSGTAVALRAVYDVGDLVYPVENEPWYHPTAGTSLFIASLGDLRLDRAKVGTHRWAGQIQAKGVAGGENVSVDRVWFQPLDEGAGVLRAPVGGELGLSAPIARDEFNQSAGTLTAKTAAVGGAWAAISGAATGDFSVTASHVVERTTTSDAGTDGRILILPVSSTAQATQIDVKLSTLAPATFVGPVVRYNSSGGEYVTISCGVSAAGVPQLYPVIRQIAGEDWVGPTITPPYSLTGWASLRLAIDTLGNIFVWMFPQGSRSGNPLLTWQESKPSLLQATGNPGIRDRHTGAAAVTRSFDNLQVWVPTFDAVLHPSQSGELRTDGMFREDSTGTAYGPVAWVEGDLPRMPVSGLENRTVQMIVKASRGDFDGVPDTGLDDLSARVFVRPCWLTVPGT